MSERYTKLFALSENLYADTAPVVIAAGALLKDNQTGKVIAQIKMRSISGKRIKAAKISVVPLDTVGNVLGDAVQYQYLDLNVGRDEDFGAKAPISMPNAATRGFSVSVEEIAFIDNTVWRSNGEPWKMLPKQQSLGLVHSLELEKQFHIKFGHDYKYIPLVKHDLWFCACGALNHSKEADCHTCRRSLAVLNSIDIAELNREKDARLAAEKEQADRAAEAARIAAEQARVRAKKNGKIAAIIIPIVVVIVVAAVLISGMVKKNNAYNDALALMDAGQYEKAIEVFTDLDGYKDSAEQIKIAESEFADLCLYEDALNHLEAKEYKEAYTIFEAIGDYKDAADYLERFSNVYVLLSESSANGEKNYEYVGELLVKETLVCTNSDGIYFHGIYFDDKGDTGTAEYEYDANGDCVESRVYNGDGSLIKRTSRVYDSSGNITKETVVMPLHDSVNTYIYTYDEKGNMTLKLWYQNLTGTGEIYSKHYYEYDEHNQLVAEGFEYEWGATSDTIYENVYDANDNLIKQVSVSTPRGYTETYEYAYDNDRRVVLKVKTVNDWTHEYRYEYDGQGNLLKETINSSNGTESKEEIITYTYGQVITYQQ